MKNKREKLKEDYEKALEKCEEEHRMDLRVLEECFCQIKRIYKLLPDGWSYRYSPHDGIHLESDAGSPIGFHQVCKDVERIIGRALYRSLAGVGDYQHLWAWRTVNGVDWDIRLGHPECKIEEVIKTIPEHEETIYKVNKECLYGKEVE